MNLLIIILLLFVGILLIIAEIVLLPGVTLAAIGAGASFIIAIALAYFEWGFTMSLVVFSVSLVLVIVTLMICMRSKSLKKISLETTVDSAASSNAELLTELGKEGITQTRLAPMGTVNIDGKLIEAKSYDGFLDHSTPIKVVGFEDSVVIVSKIK